MDPILEMAHKEFMRLNHIAKREKWTEKLSVLEAHDFELNTDDPIDWYHYIYKQKLRASFTEYNNGLILRTVFLPKEHRGQGVFTDFCKTLDRVFPDDTELTVTVRPFESTLLDPKRFRFGYAEYPDDPVESERIVRCFERHASFERVNPEDAMPVMEVYDKTKKGLPLCTGTMLVRFPKKD